MCYFLLFWKGMGLLKVVIIGIIYGKKFFWSRKLLEVRINGKWIIFWEDE